MIGALKGVVEAVGGDWLVIDVGGVGYEVSVSASARRRFGKVGEPAKLVIFTDVKETSISLFGFADSLEKQVFLLLRKVKGVGSKTALSIVSFLSAEEILSSIGRGDVTALRGVPGVGAKTAERLILELREAVGELAAEPRDTFPELGADHPRSVKAPLAAPSGAEADVILALERLGFPGERARQVVTTTIQKISNGKSGSGSPAAPKLEAGELLRLALANIQ